MNTIYYERMKWRRDDDDPATYFFRFDELELEAAAGPGDERRVGGVLEQSDEELPELERAAPLVGRQSR